VAVKGKRSARARAHLDSLPSFLLRPTQLGNSQLSANDSSSQLVAKAPFPDLQRRKPGKVGRRRSSSSLSLESWWEEGSGDASHLSRVY